MIMRFYDRCNALHRALFPIIAIVMCATGLAIIAIGCDFFAKPYEAAK